MCAIIAFASCGQPATGPLERGGDAARQDLREQARRSGAEVSKDTSWLDVLVIVGQAVSGSWYRADVFLTNEEGRLLTPAVSIAGEAFKVTDYNAHRGLYDKWPSAYYYIGARTSLVEPMIMIIGNDTMRFPLVTLPEIANGSGGTLDSILFDPSVDSTVVYTTAMLGDSMTCVMNFDGSTSYSSIRDSSWTQFDNGLVVIPSNIRAAMKPDTPNRLYLRRHSYSVTVTASGKRIGQLLKRSDHILLFRQ